MVVAKTSVNSLWLKSNLSRNEARFRGKVPFLISLKSRRWEEFSLEMFI